MALNNHHPSLEGKIAIVTGISKGIGRAIAASLAEAGSIVFGSSRSDPQMPDVTWVKADMSTTEGCAALVNQAVAQAGGIDIVVNSVGGLAESVDPKAERKHNMGSGVDLSDEAWRATMEINLYSAVRTVRATMPHLLERRGSIVNVSSITAIQPEPTMIDYCAAKAALCAFTKGIATEFGPRGVRANVVSAGPILTPAWMADGGMFEVISQKTGIPREHVLDQLVSGQGIANGGPVLRRFGDVAEIAATVLFLVSHGGGYITGADIRVDGGALRTVST